MGRKAKKWITPAALLLAAVIGAAALLPGIRHSMRDGGRAAVRQAILRSAAECYAVEGAYPASLDYLQAHYGLTVNRQDYIIIYEAYASNQLPDVQVLIRGEDRS